MKWQQRLRSSVFSLLIVAAVIPSHAHACDKLALAHEDSTCVIGAKWEGRTGTWFHESVVPEILHKLRLYPELELQVEKFRFVDVHREKEVVALRSAVAQLKQSNAHLQSQVEASAADARKAREELANGRRWYTSPLFWGITMFIAGAAIQNACCSNR